MAHILSSARDLGLQEAIRAVGGVERARAPHGHFTAIGVQLGRGAGGTGDRRGSGNRCGAHRVAARLVCQRTRGQRRRDRYARAQEYALLATLLRRSRRRAARAAVRLRGDASPLGLAHVALADAAGRAKVEAVEREYFDLFIGLGRGELLPYGSYYLTGFLHERPLARLRADLASSESSARTARSSRRITPRSCARSWPGWRAAVSRLLPAPTASFSRPSGSLDRPLFRRSGASRGREFLPARGHGRQDVHGDRNGGLRTAVIGRREGCKEEKAGGGEPRQHRTRRKVGAESSFARSEWARRAAVATTSLATGAHADTENNDEKRKARYKETEHVKTFYRVNRYPS